MKLIYLKKAQFSSQTVCRPVISRIAFYHFNMKFPQTLENLYLNLTTRKIFPSSKEDCLQLSLEQKEISAFFSQTSIKSSNRKSIDLTNKRLHEVIKSYRGGRLGKRQLLFIDDVVSS